MSIDDEKLMAFADGELSVAERAEIEAALGADAALRERLATHQRMRARVSAAFDAALTEPLPERLRATAERPYDAEVVSLAERRPSKWLVRDWGAMAASLAIGVLVGVGAMGARTPLIAPSEGGLVARGSLARALETQLASDGAAAVRIGLSFRARDGAYCRTFDLTDAATSGLACRGGDDWSVAMMVANPQGEDVRMAGAPAEILAVVDTIIVGEPLDAAGETRAREQGWR